MASIPRVFVCRTLMRRWLCASLALTLVLIGAEFATATSTVDDNVSELEPPSESVGGEEAAPSANIPLNQCPKQCVCVPDSHVDCSNLKDNRLPKDLPLETDDLRLNANNLTKMSEFISLPKLKSLTMRDNNLKRIFKSDLAKFPALEAADFSYNYIKIPLNSSICPPDYPLKRLNLNHNNIKHLNKNLDGCSNLQHLTIAHNDISELGLNFLMNLTNLQYLDLSNNNILNISYDALINVNLRVLILKENRIHTLEHAVFFRLENLKILDLYKNQITSLTRGWLYGMKMLEYLNLSTNSLDLIEKNAFEFCHSVIELDLSNNVLTFLGPSPFMALSQLDKLDLSNNDLTDIHDDAFVGVSRLSSLNLKQNLLSHMIEDPTDTFIPLTRLAFLDLSSNSITSISAKSFKGLSKLRHLSLLDNPIRTIEQHSFEELLLKQLDINSNQLHCYCDIWWLPPYLLQWNLGQELKCALPRSLKGSLVRTLSHEKLPCDGYPKPKILEQPEDMLGATGENVTMTCKASTPDKEPMSFKWKKNGAVIASHSGKPTGNKFHSESGERWQQFSELNLFDIKYDDNGMYQCIVSNDHGTAFTRRNKLSVLTLPVFTKVPRNSSGITGSHIKLECEAYGDPKPQIWWTKIGTPFYAASERRMLVMPDTSSYFITELKLSDAGFYECAANNKLGTNVSRVYLEVLDPPKLTKPIENKDVYRGDTAVLECMADGVPKPTLVWSRDGKEIKMDDRHFFTGDDQLLVIVNVDNLDSGLYTCELNNTAGSLTGTSRLTVIHIEGFGHWFTLTQKTKVVLMAAFVCCVVLTSVVWLVVIFTSRKRRSRDTPVPSDIPMVPMSPGAVGTAASHLDVDSSDSGHGDSTEQARDYSSGSDEAVDELEEEPPEYGHVIVMAPAMSTFRPHGYARQAEYVSREEMAACIPRMV